MSQLEVIMARILDLYIENKPSMTKSSNKKEISN